MRPFNTHLLLHTTCCCLIGLFLFLGLSCDKDQPKPDTIVRGVVLDSETLLPVEGAEVVYEVQLGFDVNHPYYQAKSVKTDADGKYSITFRYDEGGLKTITKDPDYLTMIKGINLHFQTQWGEVNNVDILLTPIKGKLKLNISNVSGNYNKIWVFVTNKIYEMNYGPTQVINLKKEPLIQEKGETYSEIIPLSSDIFTRIKWQYQYTTTSDPVYLDSVYVISNDTVVYNLNY